jgi:adhesin transport system membrane fusion protein
MSSNTTKTEQEDISFVNSAYAHLYDKPKRSVDILFLVIMTVIIGLIVWANIAQVDEMARGEGKVIPSSDIQKVQNFDGGLVSEILVKTGDHVMKDQPLMKIDTTRFQASLEEVKEERLSLLAKKARLNAQLKYNPRKKMNTIDFPEEIKSLEKYSVLEQNIYKNKIEEYQSTLKILELQFEQKIQEKKEIQSTIQQLSKSVKIVNDQMDTIDRMVKSGSKSRVELLNIQKELNTLEGDLNAAKLSLPRSELAISEAENKIREKVKAFSSETYNELQEVESELNKLESRLVSESDKLEKTTIRSPVNGTIKQININTIGSVVKSGVDLIEIVPDSDILLVEAKIDPKDIAFISPAQKALVKITAYDFSIYGGLEGNIVEISADSMVDPNSKDDKSYYRVVVQTKKNYLERNGETLPIIPGMVASVDIITGKKSIMDYFLKPIVKVKENALHER